MAYSVLRKLHVVCRAKQRKRHTHPVCAHSSTDTRNRNSVVIINALAVIGYRFMWRAYATAGRVARRHVCASPFTYKLTATIVEPYLRRVRKLQNTIAEQNPFFFLRQLMHIYVICVHSVHMGRPPCVFDFFFLVSCFFCLRNVTLVSMRIQDFFFRIYAYKFSIITPKNRKLIKWKHIYNYRLIREGGRLYPNTSSCHVTVTCLEILWERESVFFFVHQCRRIYTCICLFCLIFLTRSNILQ